MVPTLSSLTGGGEVLLLPLMQPSARSCMLLMLRLLSAPVSLMMLSIDDAAKPWPRSSNTSENDLADR